MLLYMYLFEEHPTATSVGLLQIAMWRFAAQHVLSDDVMTPTNVQVIFLWEFYTNDVRQLHFQVFNYRPKCL